HVFSSLNVTFERRMCPLLPVVYGQTVKFCLAMTLRERPGAAAPSAAAPRDPLCLWTQAAAHPRTTQTADAETPARWPVRTALLYPRSAFVRPSRSRTPRAFVL